jgi:hypothetical protein
LNHLWIRRGAARRHRRLKAVLDFAILTVAILTLAVVFGARPVIGL